MPGTPKTNNPPKPPDGSSLGEPWHRAASAVCDVVDGTRELADLFQGHPELLCYNYADLEAAQRTILDIVKRRAAR
jgi:hypothetical protein